MSYGWARAAKMAFFLLISAPNQSFNIKLDETFLIENNVIL